MDRTESTPLVSVIMPAYNAALYIAAAISSILDQSFSDFELLVIDDGSTDSTTDVVAGFVDRRLQLLRNERNLGLVASLTRGIEAARGKLVARMDADDISLPHRIEHLVKIIENDTGLGVVSCAYEDFDEQHETLGATILPATDAQIRRDLYCKTHVFCHAASIMRKEALSDVGGYREEWFPVEDRDLWLRMIAKWRGANSTDVLYRVRKHAQSVVATRAEYQSHLILQSSITALQNPTAPADVSRHIQCTGLARGALFVAFGLAMDADADGTARYLQQAVDWDVLGADEGFEELLLDRVVTYMHYRPGDVAGVGRGVEHIQSALPAQLSDKRWVKATALAQAHSIAAFQAAYSNETWRALRQALVGLSKDRTLWRNRGLLKLAMGMGSSHGASDR